MSLMTKCSRLCFPFHTGRGASIPSFWQHYQTRIKSQTNPVSRRPKPPTFPSYSLSMSPSIQINWVLVDPSTTEFYDRAATFYIPKRDVNLTLLDLQGRVSFDLEIKHGVKANQRHLWIWRPKERITLQEVNSEEWFLRRDNLREHFDFCHPAVWAPLTGECNLEGRVSIFDDTSEVHFIAIIDKEPPRRRR
ncbi:hypothetical protein BDN72DRAFT_82331 [Pluteus cervinus]|uniref:Uncharacterized protein n=1 Tax=Pluteus cervinus TaxID=181527 RepID=A0ACD3AQD4_9AGAR|nr:hypothetical protein BDN72DRAFT_82331 [Pluteus cervinus]